MKKFSKKIGADGSHYLKILGIVIAGILFYTIINNLGKVGNVFSFILGVFSPIIIGLCLAFILNLPLRFFEEIVFRKLTRKNGKVWSKIKRAVCLVLSLTLILSLITLLLAFIIPEFVEACTNFFMNLDEYVRNLNSTIDYYVGILHLPISLSLDADVWNAIGAWALSLFDNDSGAIAQNAINFIIGFFNSILNFVLGFALSIYILASKEKLGKLCKSLVYATMNRTNARKFISVITLTNKAFTGFVAGQCLEVLTIGILCFIGMLIFQFPYAIMISCIIAVTAFIPIFGPFIGTAIGGFIILLQSPTKAIWFVIFIIILQQIESNVIYPKIMGKQVGLPSVWVLASVTIGGGLFGIPGIIISVPICSVLYTLISQWIIMRLEKNNVCHKSMSHDATEPNFIVTETVPEETFEQIIEEAIENIEHPKTAENQKQAEEKEENSNN